MKHIKLTQNKYAIVDDEDFEWLNSSKWHLHNRKYAATKIGGRLVLMHRLIMSTPEDMHTDHINHNGLDNQRTNLKVCTHAENMANRSIQSGGVFWHSQRGKWHVRIQWKKKRVSYGLYTTKKEALAVASAVKGAF